MYIFPDKYFLVNFSILGFFMLIVDYFILTEVNVITKEFVMNVQ